MLVVVNGSAAALHEEDQWNNRSLSTTGDTRLNAVTTVSTIVFRLATTEPWFMTAVGLAVIVIVAVAIFGCLLLLAACCCYYRSKKDSCSYELAAAMQLAPQSDTHPVQKEFYV